MRSIRMLGVLVVTVLTTIGLSTPAFALGNESTGASKQLSASWDVRFSVRWDAPVGNYGNTQTRYLVVNSKGKLAQISEALITNYPGGPRTSGPTDITSSQVQQPDGRWVARVNLNQLLGQSAYFTVHAPSGIGGGCTVYNFVANNPC